jgi:hypothetical protein
VHLVIQSSNGLTQRLDARSRAILAAGGADVDVGRAGEAAFNVILDLGFVRIGYSTPFSVMYVCGCVLCTSGAPSVKC